MKSNIYVTFLAILCGVLIVSTLLGTLSSTSGGATSPHAKFSRGQMVKDRLRESSCGEIEAIHIWLDGSVTYRIRYPRVDCKTKQPQRDVCGTILVDTEVSASEESLDPCN